MVLEYILTVWDAEEPKIFNSKIYTDWANHYLEKARNKRFITDLQHDVTDGVLLADVIEAVTNEKIKSIKAKPKNSAQMVENINTCLTFLANLGVSVDGLSAKDIREGNLKAILGLFFSLSRFKQQQKSAQQAAAQAAHAQQAARHQEQSAGAHSPGVQSAHGGGSADAPHPGGEGLTRLPSVKQGGKQPSSGGGSSASKDKDSLVNGNANLNARNKPHGANTTSNDRARAQQQNQQNNNVLPTSGVSGKQQAASGVPIRATSPSAVQSAIPTPGGRSLTTSRSQSSVDRQSNRTSASSTSSTSSNKSSSSKPASSGNKNSMLDKFKFFNSKEKDKSKGLVKSTSKTSNTSTCSSRSDAESKSSVSARSGSSIEAGASSSTTEASVSSKGSTKSGKKSLARAFSSKRDPTPNSLHPEEHASRRASPTPGPQSQRTPSPNPNGGGSLSRHSPTPSRKAGPGKADPRSAQSSPTPSRKGSKIGTLIPKSSASSSSSSSSSGKAKSSSSSAPAAQAGVQGPSGGSSGIPKPSSAKGAKMKEEKGGRGSSSSKDHNKALYSNLPGMNAHRTLASSSSQTSKLQQGGGQGGSRGGSPVTTPDGRQSRDVLGSSHPTHGYHLLPGSIHPHRSHAESHVVTAEVHQPQHPRVNLQDPQRLAAEQMAATGAPPAPAPAPSIPMSGTSDSLVSSASHGSQGRSHAQSGRTVIPTVAPDMAHGRVTMTQTVNVVKPTCTTAPSEGSPSRKSDSNTQTNLSVLQRSATPKDLSRDGSQQSLHQSSDSTPSSVSGGSSHSSSESVVYKPSSDPMVSLGPVTTTSSSSPRLGVKMLNSQMGKTANNVAIVQPRHGEKIETTFDSDGRTETINKPSSNKETTFSSSSCSSPSEKGTTFLDDSGEPMDIKPMPPIMRALPYGYFRGYSGYSGISTNRNFHIPGISVPTNMYTGGSTQSRLGVNRPLFEPGKYYSGQIKRAGSNCPSISDTDYGSDVDTYDCVSGYMSDGDILKSNNRVDDWSSGYLSEGGASLYARRLQQRFREGMQAVRECMQKSSGLIDDDSFDDSSSISSGDISDTIAEISTDENLTGSSGSALSEGGGGGGNPYSSLKRTPKDLTRGFANGHPSPAPSPSPIHSKRAPNLGTSAFLGSDYNSDSSPLAGWRKYSIPQNSKLLSSDPSDYAYPYSTYEQHAQWRGREQPAYSSLRKLSNASQPEAYRGDHLGSDVESSGEKATRSATSSPGPYAHSPTPPSTKRDCETNTDQSHLLETSLRRMQNARGAHMASPGAGDGTGSGGRGGSGGGGGGFGYRRPLSNASTSSLGSTKSSGGSKGSSAVGSRLAKHGADASLMRSPSEGSNSQIPRPSSAASKLGGHGSDMGPEAYNSSTLEKKKKSSLPASKSTSSAQTERDFQSNSLGRRRLFGSKSSLSKGSSTGGSGEGLGNVCRDTIISNPHATYGKTGEKHSHYVNLQQLQAAQQAALSGGVNVNPNYVAIEYSPRNSAGTPWMIKAAGNGQFHLPEPPEPMDPVGGSTACSIQAQIQQARALSGASARILARDAASAHSSPIHQGGGGSGLRRSNSIKSTQSDCVYSGGGGRHGAAVSSSASHHGGELQRTNSFGQLSSPTGPVSPTPSNSSHSSPSRFTYPMTYGPGGFAMSPALPPGGPAMVRSSTQSSLPFPPGSLAMSKLGGSKEDEGSRLSKSSTLDYAYLSDYAYASVHGSNLSLVSTSSSVYSSAEEKHANEVRKLKRELECAQEKVSTLTTQLSTNAHVVAAFEQSLANMTSRLQSLTATAEAKDSELNELRTTIEALKRQSGLNIPDPVISPHGGRRHTSPAMVPKELHTVAEGSCIVRQMSSDSMSSINSLSSACSVTSQHSGATDTDSKKKQKKKGWLRSSFSKAFSRKKNSKGSISDIEIDTHSLRSNISAPNSPLLQVTHVPNGAPTMKGSHSSGALCDTEEPVSVVELKQQLRDKDMKLTDIRLEALSSAHQLEQLRETMNKMKNEMGALKADNDRLQRLMAPPSVHRIPLPHTQSASFVHTRSSSDSLDRSISLTDHSSLDMLLAETAANDREGKRVTITVYLGSNPDPTRTGIERPAEVLIGSLSVSGKTKWDILDNIVRKIFKEYVLRVDPVTNLGLSAESVFSYHIGEIIRTKDSEVPELLPIGYLVGDTMQIGICLKSTKQSTVDSLAFETMIPKSIIQRYVSLLLEHRRIILCGPSGTGKTYLAQKLAEHLVLRSGKELLAGSVATFNVDHKTSKDLRQYLANIAEQCENTSAHELPTVIILDNLHHVGSLGEVFNGFLSVKYQKCPYIIGTMNQATCSTTNLQLHHNFRWVLCANHMEPVKGFLGRYLRRKLVEAEVRTGVRNNDLNKIIDWVPKVWGQVNKFLETHSSSDVTIGPRLFLSCPMDIAGSQVWFTDLWNYSLVPYLMEAVREGLQVYGRRAPWEDPCDWVMKTYPWTASEDRALMHIRTEDVGYDIHSSPTLPPRNADQHTSPCSQPAEGQRGQDLQSDPLVNMLMRLQEAAGTSGPHGNDSDSISVGSHSSSHDYTGVESTL